MAGDYNPSVWLDELFKRNEVVITTVAPSVRGTRDTLNRGSGKSAQSAASVGMEAKRA
jgi:hypothetical protein